jgi:hypothetical protein
LGESGEFLNIEMGTTVQSRLDELMIEFVDGDYAKVYKGNWKQLSPRPESQEKIQ